VHQCPSDHTTNNNEGAPPTSGVLYYIARIMQIANDIDRLLLPQSSVHGQIDPAAEILLRRNVTHQPGMVAEWFCAPGKPRLNYIETISEAAEMHLEKDSAKTIADLRKRVRDRTVKAILMGPGGFRENNEGTVDYQMRGVIPYCINNGAGHFSGVRQAFLRSSFLILSAGASTKSIDTTNYVFGDAAALIRLTSEFKDTITRVKFPLPDPHGFFELEVITMGMHRFVIVPTEAFGEETSRIAVINESSLGLRALKGIEMYQEFLIQTDQDGGTKKLHYVAEATLTMAYGDPLVNFFIDLEP
jgi:hypothetical protein